MRRPELLRLQYHAPFALSARPVTSALLRRLVAPTAIVALAASMPAWAQDAPRVVEAPLRAHLAFLADDLLEGRGTGQRGGELAVRYLETQAAAIGLQPLPGGGYRQPVPVEGTVLAPESTLRFEASGGTTLTPAFGTEIVYGSATGLADTAFDAPLVFVGYGVRAPEERWDDYKGADLRGKVLVMMVNDPQPTADEPNRFGGAAYTWYGRWMYKFEEATRQGAAGVLLIHTTPSASYPWSVPANGFRHERFRLAGPGNPLEGWLQEDTARALFAAGGEDLDALRARAETRAFAPVDLHTTVHARLRSTVRHIEQANVVGIVPGSDPVLRDEAVVYSAHWDHLGTDRKADQAADDKSDHIWNGAVDNASGAAALLAMAAVAVQHPARRTQIFLWPAAEEQGLLGSAAYVAAPPWPLSRTSADLNLDSMNFVGPTRDIGVAGSERSSLHGVAAEVARRMHLVLAPAVPDLSGSYFRADHFNFAKAGVPAFNVGSAVFSGDGHFDFVDAPAESSAKMVGFKRDYHQVSDEYHADWNLAGMVQQAQFTLNLGYAVADAPHLQTWAPGDAFGQVRR